MFRNPSAHQEVQFDEPREVVDMICFANQLLRMIGRIKERRCASEDR